MQTQAAAAKGAKDAIIALVARDLIDDAGFAEWGWEQYTTLAAPWRTTIGPAHPDDAGTA